MFFHTCYLFLILSLSIAFAHFANASEPTFPRLLKPSSEAPAEESGLLSSSSTAGTGTRLLPSKMLTSVGKGSEAWRARVTSPEAGFLQLMLSTGNKVMSAQKDSLTAIWASYSFNWAKSLNSGRTVKFNYTYGQSTPGVQSSFRFGASHKSRRNSDLNDCVLSLEYGGSACTFSIDSKRTSGKLPKAVTAGTEVVVEISPEKLVSITVGDTLLLEDQPVHFDQCYVTFISDSSELKSDIYSDLRISRISVDVE